MSIKNIDNIIPHQNYIVGIGASAGGLDAINQLFENMPDNTGFSFIIVQHISPDHKSLMAELVSKHTRMPVVEAEDNMAVKPDHIYVIPSKKFMTIQSDRLRLSDKEKNKFPNNAIDVFFDSLAGEAGDKAIGIILSGTGTDGTKGAASIKTNGGIIVVQDPVTAAFDGMPNSVLGAQLGDLIVPPEMIAQELSQLLNDSPQMKAFQTANYKEESYVRELLHEIKDKAGHDFTYYKRPTILRRLAKRLSELGINSVKKYIDYVALHPDELSVISKEFLINVSSFFRDKEAFDILKTKVIPTIMNTKDTEQGVKAWCVACSTGEEAYSLAILFREWLEKNNKKFIPVKIFATDVDRDALETANRGIYPKTILQDIPGDRLAKYFVPEGNAYRIHPDIRKSVVFSYHDILKDPPFGRMDLISCRNMLIYINPEHQKEIQRKLHFALNLEGYLFLGPSENIGLMKNVMEEVDRKWKIFKCVSKNRLEDYESFFVPLEKRLRSLPHTRQKNPLNHIPELFNETLLETHNIAGLFVTRDFEVKQAVGNYKHFIDFPESGFNFNLLKMVGPELSIALSVAISKALRENQVIYSNNIRVQKNGSHVLMNITVKPYNQPKDYQHPFLFVTMEEIKEPLITENEGTIRGKSIKDELRVSELEDELSETRANMQLLLEEVETSNEELRSINEEAVSTNEELQSTNEELQSLNEELHTVSAEHQLKIKELMELNDDLNNYFNNSNIGQVLVDRDMIIRRFTPSVSRMINLIESDLNRSIEDITTRIKNIDLVSSIRAVIKTGTSIEKEILLSDDTFFLMRMNPYIRQDKSIDGVVINFIDISELKMLNSIVQAIFESAPYGISAKKAVRNEKNEIIDFEYMAINAACERLYGVPEGTLKGTRIRSYKNFREEFFDVYRKVVNTGEPLHYESYEPRLDKWLDVNVVKMMDGVVTTHVDITEIKKANKIIEQSYENLKATSGKLAEMNNQLEQSNLDLMQFASIASHDLKEPLRKIETFGNLLNEKLKAKLDEKELRYVEKIVKASSRMQVLVEDVLTFSKLSNSELPFIHIDLNKILNRIVDDLEITIREKNAQIVIGNLPEVKAVQGQMHQLFQNLISNALKFNDKPTPVISIHTEPLSGKHAGELQIDPSKYNCIVIKDNGIGIEEQFKEKIFGIFQRLNGNRYEGTGIGLAVCKKIVEKNRGYLLLESLPGQGTEFFIIMPKAGA
jgi:two-component system CheB/CheR fusion protein